ncbi:MAG: transposase [Oscillospiraceae bacterium]
MGTFLLLLVVCQIPTLFFSYIYLFLSFFFLFLVCLHLSLVFFSLPPFVSVAKNFPNAKICIDPFHVIQRLNDMADQVHIRCQNQFQNNGNLQNYRKIKNLSRLLKTCEYRQTLIGAHTSGNQKRLQDAFRIFWRFMMRSSSFMTSSVPSPSPYSQRS